MIQFTKCPALHATSLIGKIGTDLLFEAEACFAKADLLQIRDHICAIHLVCIPGEMAAQREISVVIEIEFLQLERTAGEEHRIAVVTRRHSDWDRCLALKVPNFAFRLSALLGRKIKPPQCRLGTRHQMTKPHTAAAET